MHKIRAEEAKDIAAIRDINIAAFENHPFSQQTEHLIVEELRKQGALTLSLVAEFEGRAIGHIAFSPILIDKKDVQWHGVGPVTILPEFQSKGIGSALVHEGLSRMKFLGSHGIVVLGEPVYYTRFGFAYNSTVTYPGPPADHFMCQVFSGSVPAGTVSYHPAFDITA